MPNQEVPHSREAEEYVIGSALINPESYYEVSRVLGSADFYIVRHQYIWDAIRERVEKNQGVDIFTISDILKSNGRLEESGGSSYLTALTSRVPSSLHAVEYAESVREMSLRRTGIRIANTLAANSYDLGKEFSLEKEAMSMISATRGGSRRIETTDAARELSDLIDNPVCYTTGIPDIDGLIGGLFPRELSILAGVQGTGKSAEKMQGARRNSEAGRRVMLCDLEMTAAQTWFRMACGDLKVDVNSVRSGRVGDAVKKKVKDYAFDLARKYKDNLVIYNAPMTPADMLSAAILEQPDLIYVDVLKNISGKPPRETEISWYDFVLNFLRITVAQNKAINAHVQVLHHINRSANKEDRKPSMQDLKYAGESDADNVFLLHREKKDEKKEDANPTRVVVTWITDKSRFGWTGEEDVNFDLVEQRFYGMARENWNK